MHDSSDFNALLLFILSSLERPGIYDSKAIDRGQEKLLEALKSQVARNRSGDSKVFPGLLSALNELRVLGVKHMQHLSWFRGNWSRLCLPPLFAEIFDIPKGDDDHFVH